jgi:hypothetical protein
VLPLRLKDEPTPIASMAHAFSIAEFRRFPKIFQYFLLAQGQECVELGHAYENVP